jgi:hypothetical protein
VDYQKLWYTQTTQLYGNHMKGPYRRNFKQLVQNVKIFINVNLHKCVVMKVSQKGSKF